MHTFVRAIIAFAMASAAVAMLVGPAAQAQQPKAAATQKSPAEEAVPVAPPVLNQVALTEAQIEAVLSAQKEFDAIDDKASAAAGDTPDQKLDVQYEEAAKKAGFASYAAYTDVVDSISLVLAGFDPKTKTYIGPEGVLKAQLAAVQADPKLPPADKEDAAAEINAALQTPAPAVDPKSNIALVGKYYDRLVAALSGEK